MHQVRADAPERVSQHSDGRASRQTGRNDGRDVATEFANGTFQMRPDGLNRALQRLRDGVFHRASARRFKFFT